MPINIFNPSTWGSFKRPEPTPVPSPTPAPTTEQDDDRERAVTLPGTPADYEFIDMGDGRVEIKSLNPAYRSTTAPYGRLIRFVDANFLVGPDGVTPTFEMPGTPSSGRRDNSAAIGALESLKREAMVRIDGVVEKLR